MTSKPTILVVDDDSFLATAYKERLGYEGFNVILAANGEEALSELAKQVPDLMLLDLIMPGLDGFQILREKSRDDSIRNIPVIVVSSINPTGETIISNNLTITRKEGLSVHDLIGSIQSINRVLSQSS